MKNNTEERKNRWSLTLVFSGIMLLLLIANAVVISAAIFYLVYRGSLQMGDTPLTFSSLILNILLWSIIDGVILAAISSRFHLKPVNRVLNAIDQLASGNYSVRISFKGPLKTLPTVAGFTRSFNTMASELQQTEMLRSDFINNFSHEFKTPIVSIAGFAKLLKRGNLSEEKQAEYLDVIEEESLRLSQLATNILNLTKVENQSILTDVRRYNLSEQLRTSALVLEGKWTKKHIELLLPMEEYYICGNEELLKQVWLNLLDNAIKFSPDYGTVEIRVIEDGSDICTEVSNYGDAIPPEKIDRIFNKFYQADESHAVEGNGVGLAVVKKIVDLHSGHVSVKCQDGKTVFTVRIPQKTGS